MISKNLCRKWIKEIEKIRTRREQNNYHGERKKRQEAHSYTSELQTGNSFHMNERKTGNSSYTVKPKTGNLSCTSKLKTGIKVQLYRPFISSCLLRRSIGQAWQLRGQVWSIHVGLRSHSPFLAHAGQLRWVSAHAEILKGHNNDKAAKSPNQGSRPVYFISFFLIWLGST